VSDRNDSMSNKKFYFELLILMALILFPFLLIKNVLYVITTPSMVPSLNVGDVVIQGYKAPEEIKTGNETGDILILKGPQYYYQQGFDPWFWNDLEENTPIIHRAIEKKKIGEKWYFLTKGDNNWVADGGLQFINNSDDYILIEYNTSTAIYVSETEILGVVVFTIPFIGYLNLFFPVILISLICIFIFVLILKGLKYKIRFVKIEDER